MINNDNNIYLSINFLTTTTGYRQSLIGNLVVIFKVSVRLVIIPRQAKRERKKKEKVKNQRANTTMGMDG